MTTPNAEYQKSIQWIVDGRLKLLKDQFAEESFMLGSQLIEMGYLQCLRDVLSYGELPKVWLDKINTTLAQINSRTARIPINHINPEEVPLKSSESDPI